MFVEDLTPFFAEDGVGNAVATIDGIAGVVVQFEALYSMGNVGPIGMASSQPAITLPTASVPTSPVGKAVAVGSATYTIAAHEPDGTGISRLLLEAA